MGPGAKGGGGWGLSRGERTSYRLGKGRRVLGKEGAQCGQSIKYTAGMQKRVKESDWVQIVNGLPGSAQNCGHNYKGNEVATHSRTKNSSDLFSNFRSPI